MESGLERQLGRIIGQIEVLKDSFEARFHDLKETIEREREEARADRRETLRKLDELDSVKHEVGGLREYADALKTQTYSNKTEIEASRALHRVEMDKLKDKIAATKTENGEAFVKLEQRIAGTERLHTRILGVAAAFATVGGAALTGLYWVITSWHEVIPFLKSLAGTKP